MSNQHIIARITDLIDAVEVGETSILSFCSQFDAHYTALDGLDYSMVVAARQSIARVQLDCEANADAA